MGRSSDTNRLFAALYPPQDVAEALLTEAGKVAASSHRFVKPEQVHLTLLFLGDTPARDLREVTESIQRSAMGLGPLELKPRELITLPQRGDPRLLAAETDAPSTLIELHRRLAQRLAHRVRPRDRERFLPHLTLVRFDPQKRMPPVRAPLDMPPFRVDRVRLMRSRLLRDGTVHEEVAGIPLGTGAS